MQQTLDGNGSELADTLRYVEHFASTGSEVWASACKMNLEGIVSKRLDAPYDPSLEPSPWRIFPVPAAG